MYLYLTIITQTGSVVLLVKREKNSIYSVLCQLCLDGCLQKESGA